MEIQDKYRHEMAAQLKQWSAQINLLAARITNPGFDIQVGGNESLHELRLKQRVAYGQMRVLGRASDETWNQSKETAEYIWRDLEIGVVNAYDKLKQGVLG